MTCVGRINSASPRFRSALAVVVLCSAREGGRARRRNGKFWNNVERPRAANARLPLCLLQLPCSSLGQRAGRSRVVWAVSVCRGKPRTRTGQSAREIRAAAGTGRVRGVGTAGVRYEARLENWG
jgi:hypothetical protein